MAFNDKIYLVDIEPRIDTETGTITKKVELGVLYGWQDDIV